MNIKHASYMAYLPALLFIMLTMQTSCKKFVEIELAANLIQTETLFETDENALTAVSGTYAQLRAVNPSYANAALSIYCGLSADEFATRSSMQEYDAFNKNALLSTSSIVDLRIWTAAYRVVYRTNAIIEGLQKSKGVSSGSKNQYMGEMKLVRAFSYFTLVNLFGDVPLITSTIYQDNQGKSRAPQADVYQKIIDDLVDAVDLLPAQYADGERSRVNKFAAAALLARVYLHKEDWENAEKFSSLVISSDDYELTTDLLNVFKANSREIIWQIAPPNGTSNSIEGATFIPSNASSIPTMFLTESLLAAFEPGDLRKATWLGANTVAGTPYYYPFKYKRRLRTPLDEYTVVFRLAEQYLIRSEANLKLNKMDEALSDLNMIRSRAQLEDLEITDETEMLEAIVRERRVELFAEWGHRWFDLKRYKLINTVLGAAKGADWQETDSWFPIPLREIQINTSLSQNAGYN